LPLSKHAVTEVPSDVVTRLKTTYPKLLAWNHEIAGMVVCKPLGVDGFNRFLDKTSGEFNKSEVARIFNDCVLYPTGDVLAAVTEEVPALPYTIGNAVLREAGLTAGVEKKEL